MKFTQGEWLMRPGVRVSYATEVWDWEARNGQLDALAATKPIRHRGDTLDGPALRVRIGSPMPDVVSVRVDHFEGETERGPQFELFGQPGFAPEIALGEDQARVAAGRLEARLDRKSWRLEFLGEGRPLTRSGWKHLGYAQVEGQGAFLHEGLALSVGESVYGLGERFTAFVKNGQVVDIWQEDGGTGSEHAYKNVPFYLTDRGYGVLVRHPGRVSFEVASERVSRVQFSVPGEWIEYLVIYGPTPKEILAKYTALTGRPALPPAWSFGLWLTTSFTTSYDEATVSSFVQGMADRGIPLHVFHFDCFWMRGFRWCDFQWDPEAFPDPEGFLGRLKERGLRLCAWINPYIAQRSELFEEGRRGGYLLRRPDGSVWQTDQWQAGMGIVDFTNPAAREWFAGHLERLVDQGIDCFKTDFGERIPTEVRWHDGSDPERMHNYYAHVYNRTVFEALERKRGRGEAVLFARSGTAGTQRYPVHWGGDCWSTFESMAETLRGGLSLALSGYGFWSHDIGGFEGKPPAAVYKRWVQFGLLSSHSRLHGSSSYRVPWEIDEEATDVLRFFVRLKCRLMPYLFAKAVEAHLSGVPMLRPMLLEFPDDPTCRLLDRQYMLGDALLVAPVFREDGEVEYYLPDGLWTNLLDGRRVEGGRWVRETHGFLSLPLMVRDGTVLPMGSVDDRPDYDYAEGLTLEVYGRPQAATVEVPNLDGSTSVLVSAWSQDGTGVVQVDRPLDGWSVLLVGVQAAEGVVGAVAEATPRGLLLRATPGSQRIAARW
ncbi:MAG: alpha-xylosidase [Fimbriimonadaceae bacterium]